MEYNPRHIFRFPQPAINRDQLVSRPVPVEHQQDGSPDSPDLQRRREKLIVIVVVLIISFCGFTMIEISRPQRNTGQPGEHDTISLQLLGY